MRHLLLALAASLVVLAGHAPTQAQEFPSKTVKIVVPYPPAGTTDILARLVAQKLTETFKQQVIVENKPGASGNLGSEQVARAPADGHTLLMGTAGNLTLNPAVLSTMPIDPTTDLQAITLVAEVPNLMVVNPSVPAKTVAEFIAWAKGRPKNVFFATTSAGNSPHMSGELFNLAAGTEMIAVHYKGSGPALQDLVAGQGVQAMFDNMPSVIGHVRSGTLRPLAVTTPKRSATLPDTPTLDEAGLKGYEVTAWFGIFAPAKTPPAVVAALHKAIGDGMRHPEMLKRLSELGAEPVLNTPDVFASRVVTEIAKWKDVARKAKVSIE